MPRTEFIATAFHVPERVVTNDDLAQLMDTSDEWIVQRSGIKTRYWVSNGETGASLATAAARKALAQAGMRAADLDCIVYCTCTPDHFEPGTVCSSSASSASPTSPPSTCATSAPGS